MKKAAILCFMFLIAPLFIVGQSIENVEFISPFHDDVAAIKKDGKWGFIDKQGNLVIGLRTDLVNTKTDDGEYPMFSSERCKIVDVKAGISYFGFIDTSGKTVIESQFLNVTNFNKNNAMALKLDKQIISRNTALDKDMVNYRYYEVLIDTEGEITYYLTQDAVNIVLDKSFLRAAPQITSKLLTDDLYAVMGKNKTWNIIKVKQEL